MHARRPALRPPGLRGAALVVGMAMLAVLMPGAGPARGGEIVAPIDVAWASSADAAASAADATPATPATPAARTDPAAPATPDSGQSATPPGLAPSEMYLDSLQHAGDPNTFVPGGRVTVGFQPRPGDGSAVGGTAPQPLPAGRLSGTEMDSRATAAPAPAPGSLAPTASTGDSRLIGPVAIPARATSFEIPATIAPAPPAATGLRREVYGFLPYWQVSDPATRLKFSVLSDIAYFSLGVDGSGNLQKRNSDGSLTTGWAGWTSAKMTDVITQAHLAKTRVTLTLSVFAWTPGQAAVQAALLGSPAARATLVRQAVAAVRDRGADGINLDFEPLVTGREDGFVALVHAFRAAFQAIGPGYSLTFDTLGQPANYPLEQAVGADAADAVFVMGYDYRTAGSANAGSVDPLAGPAYDLTETVQTYLARIPASRIILGVPYYGRAWSTVSDARNAKTRSGPAYGYSTAVTYDSAAAVAAQHGRRYDDREISAWVAYQKQNCTSSGCTTTWRQLYYDDAQTLRARYDMVNLAGIRGVGIWALGYDGTRPELYQALADKFLTDTTPPLAGINLLPPAQANEGFGVSWTGVDDWHGVASYDVEVSTDGGAWLPWISGTQATGEVWLGSNGHSYAFRVRARDGVGNLSAWNVTTVFATAPTLAVGGFGRVTSDQLNVRSAPGTAAQRLGSAGPGDVFAITGGPTSKDGYTWYEVSGPLTAWQPAGYVRTDAWVAAAGIGVSNLVAIPAPNSTTVQAVIGGVAFGATSSPAATIGPGAAAVAARSFSPNGDGSKDQLSITWTNRRALDGLALAVFGPTGSLLGSVPLSANLGPGPQSATWDGMLGGAPVPDGGYVLQLRGTAAGLPVAWPSADPVTPGQRAAVGVSVDTQPPTLSGAAISATRLSPNGDGRFESVTATGTGSTDAVGWSLVVTSNAGGQVVRTLSGSGARARATWDGRADDGSVVADGSYRATLAVFDAAGNVAATGMDRDGRRTPPAVGLTATPGAFSPDGDGTADTAGLGWTSSEAVTGYLRIVHGTTLVRKWTVNGTSGTSTWTGLDAAGRPVPDGRYTPHARRDGRDREPGDPRHPGAGGPHRRLPARRAGALLPPGRRWARRHEQRLVPPRSDGEGDARDPRRIGRGGAGGDDGGHPVGRHLDVALGRPRGRRRDGAARDLRRRTDRRRAVRPDGAPPRVHRRRVLRLALDSNGCPGRAGHGPLPLGGAAGGAPDGDAAAGGARTGRDEGRRAGRRLVHRDGRDRGGWARAGRASP